MYSFGLEKVDPGTERIIDISRSAHSLAEDRHPDFFLSSESSPASSNASMEEPDTDTEIPDATIVQAEFGSGNGQVSQANAGAGPNLNAILESGATIDQPDDSHETLGTEHSEIQEDTGAINHNTIPNEQYELAVDIAQNPMAFSPDTSDASDSHLLDVLDGFASPDSSDSIESPPFNTSGKFSNL